MIVMASPSADSNTIDGQTTSKPRRNPKHGSSISVVSRP
jgi:hypothetical protein